MATPPTENEHMRFRNLLLGAALTTTLPVATTAVAGEGHEKSVKLEDIPAPARQTILKEAKGAPILKVEEEHKHGKTLYEASVQQGKDEMGIVVDAKGKLVGKHSEKAENHAKHAK